MSQKKAGSNQSGNTTTDEKAPGRTIGVTVMTLTIVFVAIWMNQQSNQLASQGLSISADPGQALGPC